MEGLGDYDFPSGKGSPKKANHLGKQHFYVLLDERLDEYLLAEIEINPGVKRRIRTDIRDDLLIRMRGSFKIQEGNGAWVAVDEQTARGRVSQVVCEQVRLYRTRRQRAIDKGASEVEFREQEKKRREEAREEFERQEAAFSQGAIPPSKKEAAAQKKALQKDAARKIVAMQAIATKADARRKAAAQEEAALPAPQKTALKEVSSQKKKVAKKETAAQKKVALEAAAIIDAARQKAASQKPKVQKPSPQKAAVHVQHLIQKPHLAVTEGSKIHDFPFILPNPQDLSSQKAAVQHPMQKPASLKRQGSKKRDLPVIVPTAQPAYPISRQVLPLVQQPHVNLSGQQLHYLNSLHQGTCAIMAAPSIVTADRPVDDERKPAIGVKNPDPAIQEKQPPVPIQPSLAATSASTFQSPVRASSTNSFQLPALPVNAVLPPLLRVRNCTVESVQLCTYYGAGRNLFMAELRCKCRLCDQDFCAVDCNDIGIECPQCDHDAEIVENSISILSEKPKRQSSAMSQLSTNNETPDETTSKKLKVDHQWGDEAQAFSPPQKPSFGKQIYQLVSRLWRNDNE